MSTGPFTVKDSEVREFHENGVVCLRNVFHEDWIDKCANGILKNLKNPSKYSEKLEVGTGAYFNDYLNWDRVQEFKDYVFNSPAKDIVAQLLDTEYISFYYEHVFVKEPGASKVTPWHQDMTYFPISGLKTCILWMPIDPVPEDTCIQFVRGSHKWNRCFYPKKFATEKYYLAEHEVKDDVRYEEIPDVDGEAGKYEILTWSLQPGDCIAFNMLLLHGAPANHTKLPRRVLSTRWLVRFPDGKEFWPPGDDCVLTERPWTTSPPVTGGLQPGDPVICDQFPLVWRRH